MSFTIENYRAECLVALRNFISESSNENKLELYMAYEMVDDEAEAAEYLGTDLAAVLHRILRQNAHDDAYLTSLKTTYGA